MCKIDLRFLIEALLKPLGKKVRKHSSSLGVVTGVDETAHLPAMRMEINSILDSSRLQEASNKAPYGLSLLTDRLRLPRRPEPIDIIALDVGPGVAMDDPVRVRHGDYYEIEAVEQGRVSL